MYESYEFAYPKYGNYKEPCLQSPWVLFSTCGCPQSNHYTKTDADRTYIKLPLETSHEAISFIEHV